MFEVSVEAVFPAAHALRNYYGKTEPIHGHNWRVRITLEGEKLDDAGLLVDFIQLKKSIGRRLEQVDHTFLNEVEPFTTINPSAENIARYIAEEIGKDVDRGRARVLRVEVWETEGCSATYRP